VLLLPASGTSATVLVLASTGLVVLVPVRTTGAVLLLPASTDASSTGTDIGTGTSTVYARPIRRSGLILEVLWSGALVVLSAAFFEVFSGSVIFRVASEEIPLYVAVHCSLCQCIQQQQQRVIDSRSTKRNPVKLGRMGV
jgi:hypothetical protein